MLPPWGRVAMANGHRSVPSGIGGRCEMLELRFFGSGSAGYRGVSLPYFPRRKPYLLLCYLVLNRHVHSRERVAAVFWGDHSTGESRKYLRNAIWRLRGALRSIGAPADAYLQINDDSIAFSGQGPYRLDVETFEGAVGELQDVPGQDLTPAQAHELDRAVELYDGDLLEGVYEDWCLYDRERLRLMYLNALGKLMEFYEGIGDYERSLAYGERILSYDNAREQVHRRIMNLYWLMGNRSAALAQYDRCVEMLRETWNVAPMEETVLLYRRIISQMSPSRAVGLQRGDGLDRQRLEEARRRLQRLERAIDRLHVQVDAISKLVDSLLV